MIPQIARRLEEIFLEIAEEYEFEIIEQKVRSDHVHLFVSAPSKVFCEPIGKYDVKYISQAYLYRNFPDFGGSAGTRSCGRMDIL